MERPRRWPRSAVVWKRVADLAALDTRFAAYLDQRDELKSRLEDLALFLRNYAGELDAAPDRLQAVEDRLAAVERLKKKYGPTLADVLSRQTALRDELAELGATEERAAALDLRERETRGAFLSAARQLSSAREAAGRVLGKALETDLAELAMPQVTRRDSTAAAGPARVVDATRRRRRGDSTSRRIQAKTSGRWRASPPAASCRGSCSRSTWPPRADEAGRTLIFDEVDAGIGGAAADAVGARLQTLGRRTQVMCITHLPQIAARADAHFQIAKQVRSGRTQTLLARLDDHGREAEIGRMIAGAAVSPQVLASARELLDSRSESENKAKGESERSPRPKAKGRAMKGKYFVETFGCQMNYHDSERIAGLLEADGYEPASDDRSADVIVVNTCSVRERAEEKLYTRLGEIREQALEREHRHSSPSPDASRSRRGPSCFVGIARLTSSPARRA